MHLHISLFTCVPTYTCTYGKPVNGLSFYSKKNIEITFPSLGTLFKCMFMLKTQESKEWGTFASFRHPRLVRVVEHGFGSNIIIHHNISCRLSKKDISCLNMKR